MTNFKSLLLMSLVVSSGIGGGDAVKCDGESTSNEARLLRKLFCGEYDKSERPVKNHNTAVNITAKMHVQNYDVNERKSTLSVYVWMSFSWRDEFLTWDRTEYGIDKLIVDSGELWRPTFVAFHNLKSGTGDTACASHPCEVNQTGAVVCLPPCEYEALCVSSTANWPFDSLKCTMFLGTWLEDFGKINISKNANVSTRSIEVPHAEWKLQSAIILHIFLPDNTSYPALEYIFTLERHVAIYGAILTPGFLLVVIALCVLWMNSNSNERLYILCACCMGHFSYLEYLYWRVPYHGEQVPTMLLFFRDSLIINLVILAFTIVLRHAGPKPDGADRLVDKLAFRVASTNVGRVFLQTDNIDSSTAASPADENANCGQSESTDCDTVNLVVDEPDTNVPKKRPTGADLQHANVVAAFMDRIMFACCIVSYAILLWTRMPREIM